MSLSLSRPDDDTTCSYGIGRFPPFPESGACVRQAGCELDAVLSASRRFLGSRSFPLLIRVGDPHAGTYVCSRCGRFTHRHAWAGIHRMHRLTSPASNVQPSYTVCATVNVVTSFQDTRILEPMRWVPNPTLVVEAAQRLDEAVRFQRASRDRNDEAVLPRSVQANSLPHRRVRY